MMLYKRWMSPSFFPALRLRILRRANSKVRFLDRGVFWGAMLLLLGLPSAQPEKGLGLEKRLGLQEFVELACRNDSVFQEILMDQLRLQYAKVLALPTSDILLGVRAEYGITWDGTPEPLMKASLSKLFPYSGTSLDMRYSNRTSSTGDRVNDATVEFGVDIARNALGKSVQMLDKITGIETEVARHQIVEAYEDYLSQLMEQYYRWVAAYESVKAARAAVLEGEKLLENIDKKKKSYIAYQVDVDKAELQLVGKRERLVDAQRDFDGLQLNMLAAIRDDSIGEDSTTRLLPDSLAPSEDRQRQPGEEAEPSGASDLSAEESRFFEDSRTWKILRLLLSRDSVALERAADNLLPSIRPYAGVGYNDGSPGVLENSRVYAGISFDVFVQRTKEKAEQQVARIDASQRELATQNVRVRLRTQIAELHQRIASQIRSIELAARKLALSESIHEAETTEYLYGRADINDLIQALNTLQQNRFDKINREIQLEILRVEWKRLTDQLVTKKDTEKTPVPEVR